MKTKLLLIGLANLTGYALAQTQSYVYTPRGTQITNSWIMPETTNQQRLASDQSYITGTRTKLIYPGEAYSSSNKFNCHGYAWHMHEGGSMRWIGWIYSNGEDAYMTDGSYIKVCNEVYPGKVSWGSDDHSAVTTATPGRWRSKWGPQVYVEHDYNDTPYNNSVYNYYSSTTITGPHSLCNGSSGTYSVGPGANYSWSCGGGLVATSGSSGQTYTVQPNTSSGSGWVQVTVTSPCDGRSITSTKYIDLGLPQISSFLINGSTHGGGGLYVCTGNSQYIQPQPTNSSYSYNWSLSFGNPGNGNLASYGNAASFTPYSAECFGVSVQATNGCGTTSSGVTICGQNCFARYAVYPNPARDYITIQFDEVDKAEALPDQIDLLADASTKPIKTVNVQDTYSGKTFKNGNQVEIDARDLPRGTYYLHIKNSRRTDKEIDAIRIVLE